MGRLQSMELAYPAFGAAPRRSGWPRSQPPHRHVLKLRRVKVKARMRLCYGVEAATECRRAGGGRRGVGASDVACDGLLSGNRREVRKIKWGERERQ